MKTKPKTKLKAVSTFDVLGGGFALSFPSMSGGTICARGEKANWTFRTLTDIKGNTRCHIGYVDTHNDAWHEVTKTTFHKVQKELRGRLQTPADE